MTKFSLKYLLLLAGVVLLTLHSCKKDEEQECCDPTNPDCINYDPCLDVEEPTAEIILQESINTFDGIKWPGNDSVFLNNVQFSARYQGDSISHTWYLGAEVITEPVFSREHSTVPPENRPAFITVSHVIEFPVDSACYTNLTGRDSTSRTYRLIRYYNEYATLGLFRGVFEHETDSFDFKLSIINPDGSDGQIYDDNIAIVAVNFHNEGDSISGFKYAARNSLGVFTGDASANARGFMTIEEAEGEYKLEYRYGLEDYIVIARKLD